MMDKFEILKGIHPGKIIERDLKKRHITQRALAEKSGIYFQTINAIISGRRNITLEVSLKLENALGYDEGFLLVLQDYYHIAAYKKQKSKEQYSTAPKIRKSLFWDTEFHKIDWDKYKKTVINRVWERGNQEEKKEIARFYNIKTTELKKFISTTNHPLHTTNRRDKNERIPIS